MRRTLLFLISSFAAAACGDNGQDQRQVTWFQDVAPLLSKSCMSCHQEGQIAPFVLTDYDTAVEYGSRILEQVDKGAMPPYYVREEPECTPTRDWANDLRLTDAEKATLHAWVAGGFVKGTEATIAPPTKTDLEGANMTLTPQVGYVSSGQLDEFACVVLDPQFTDPINWVTGLQVKPGIDAILHHVAVSKVMPTDTLRDGTKVSSLPRGTVYKCNNSQPVAEIITFWTPGTQPLETTPGLAIPMAAGALFIMHLHYHPMGQTHPVDVTAYDFRVTKDWPERQYLGAMFGNWDAAPELLPGPADDGPPRFLIPKGAADHVERSREVMNFGSLQDVRVYSMTQHMHLTGVHMSAQLDRPAARGSEPKTECLVNGGWHFDWQRTYIYDAPTEQLPTIETGDVVDVSCRYDNRIENPFVQRMLAEAALPPQPIDLKLGLSTFDEMCIEIVGLSALAPPEPANRSSFTYEQLGIPARLTSRQP